MKKIKELKLSRTPWSVSPCVDKTVGTVIDKNGKPLQPIDEPMEIGDAQMASAAPDMYESLWDHCFGESTTVNCAKCGGNDHGDGIEHCSKDCPLYKSRSALAKASGITR